MNALRVAFGLLGLLWSAAGAPAATLDSGPRVALVIGNAGYKTMPLANPINDARAVADAVLEGKANATQEVAQAAAGGDEFVEVNEDA